MKDRQVRILFPCDNYPIRVIGKMAPDFEEVVVVLVKKYTQVKNITTKESKSSNYLSVLLVIVATSEEQLKTIHQVLMNSGRVQMVL